MVVFIVLLVINNGISICFGRIAGMTTNTNTFNYGLSYNNYASINCFVESLSNTKPSYIDIIGYNHGKSSCTISTTSTHSFSYIVIGH